MVILFQRLPMISQDPWYRHKQRKNCKTKICHHVLWFDNCAHPKLLIIFNIRLIMLLRCKSIAYTYFVINQPKLVTLLIWLGGKMHWPNWWLRPGRHFPIVQLLTSRFGRTSFLEWGTVHCFVGYTHWACHLP